MSIELLQPSSSDISWSLGRDFRYIRLDSPRCRPARHCACSRSHCGVSRLRYSFVTSKMSEPPERPALDVITQLDDQVHDSPHSVPRPCLQVVLIAQQLFDSIGCLQRDGGNRPLAADQATPEELLQDARGRAGNIIEVCCPLERHLSPCDVVVASDNPWHRRARGTAPAAVRHCCAGVLVRRRLAASGLTIDSCCVTGREDGHCRGAASREHSENGGAPTSRRRVVGCAR